ncbi:MAG TPA: hypothetical protein VE978_14675 [Chitinophagales bacterium]|nr:hypothetical protein [Chitinophagales bacterium]
MKTSPLVVLVVLLFPFNSFSQQGTNDATLPLFGLGLKMTPFHWSDIFLNEANLFIPGSSDVISITIDPTPHLRIEPELGLSITTDNNGPVNSSTTIGLHAGIFLGRMWQKGSTNFFAGPRFQYLVFSSTGQHDISGVLIGVATGGEYFFSKYFSAGAEFHVSDFILEDSSTEDKFNTISTDAAFTARVFFK